jgi:hypothetical protein
MAISTTTNRIAYTGDGTTTQFTYPFKIFAATDLQVYVNAVLKTLTTDYTVSGVGSESGGTVTFNTAPPSGQTVLIVRIEPLTQLVDLPSNDKFPSQTVEDALDKLTMLVQQLNEVDRRAMKFPITSLFTDLTIPDPQAGRFVRWKSDLSGLENADIAALGGIGLPLAITQGGTGATTVDTAQANLRVSAVAQFDEDPATTTGLTWGFKAGYLPNGTKKNAGTVALTSNATNYVELDTSTGVMSKTTTGFTSGKTPIRKIVTNASGILTSEDVRPLVYVTPPATPSALVFTLHPLNAVFPSSNFPQLVKNAGTNIVDYTLDYDDTSVETAYWVVPIPATAQFTPNTAGQLVLYYRVASATSGAVVWQLKSVTRGDNEAWDSASGINTNTLSPSTVPGTAGAVKRITAPITLTGINPGRVYQFALSRVGNDANDTLSGDCKLIVATVEISG